MANVQTPNRTSETRDRGHPVQPTEPIADAIRSEREPAALRDALERRATTSETR